MESITLESLLKEPSRIGNLPYRFCATPECPVVYFSQDGSALFHTSDLKVRVGIKEKEDPIPLCYCFGWDRERIWKEIRETGRSTAMASITQEVKAGNCFCERSNPQGTCCLGDVSEAVKEGMDLYRS
jgi:hypothetical protein